MPASLTSTAGSSWSPTLVTGSSGFKPFPKDPAKQARYEEYLRLGRGEKPSGNTDIRFVLFYASFEYLNYFFYHYFLIY